MVTDEDYLNEVLPMLDLSLLKFKERDFMEGIFKFWGASDAKSKEAFPVSCNSFLLIVISRSPILRNHGPTPLSKPSFFSLFAKFGSNST